MLIILSQLFLFQMKLFDTRNIKQRLGTFYSGYQSLSGKFISQGERGEKSFQAYLALWKVRWKIGDPVIGSQLQFVIVLCTLSHKRFLQHSLVFTFVSETNLYLNDRLFPLPTSHGNTEGNLHQRQKGILTKWPLSVRTGLILKSRFQSKSEIDKN